MSKNIAIVFFILFIIVALIGYLNYNRLNKIQDELIKRDTLLAESNQSIEQKEDEIGNMEEGIKEAEETKSEAGSTKDEFEYIETEMQARIKTYQEELQELRERLEETIAQSKIESQTIVQLNEEKSKLEDLLKEQETQWKSREEENQKAISSLKKEIDRYEENIDMVSKKIINLEEYLDTEIIRREDLEKEIIRYEDNIAELDAKLSLEQDNEIRAQEISRLMVTKQQLEEEIEDKDTLLEQITNDYQKLQIESSGYQEKIAELHKKSNMIEEQSMVLNDILANIEFLKEEKSKLEALLYGKEAEWLAKEEDNKKTIARLHTEVQEYELSLKEIGNEMLSLKQEITEKVTLKEKVSREIDRFENEINNLRQEVADFQDLKESYEVVFNQLQSNKELLEKQLEGKGLEIEQQEYEELLQQISIYQQQVEEIREELTLAKEKKEFLLNEQFAMLKNDMETLEKALTEKEDEWRRENKENQELISYLKEQLERYQEEIEVVKLDSSILKEEMAVQFELQQERVARIKDREEQIADFVLQIEEHAKRMEDYEVTVKELRSKLRQQENLTYQEQQELLERIVALATERELIQDSIDKYHKQISRLEYEIAELQGKLAGLETESEYYEVKSGDCLWTIARDKYKEGLAWTKIFRANRQLIENPDLIYPYQRIIIPE